MIWLGKMVERGIFFFKEGVFIGVHTVDISKLTIWTNNDHGLVCSQKVADHAYVPVEK